MMSDFKQDNMIKYIVVSTFTRKLQYQLSENDIRVYKGELLFKEKWQVKDFVDYLKYLENEFGIKKKLVMSIIIDNFELEDF